MSTAFKGYCPRCEQELVAGEFRGMMLDMCTKCYGILLEQPRLLALLDEMAGDLKDTIDISMPLEVVPDSGGDIACPRCREAMNHYGYMDTKWVMIDLCPGCNMLWLDTDELGMVSLMYARSKLLSERIHRDRYVPPSLAPRVRANSLGGVIQGMLMGGSGL